MIINILKATLKMLEKPSKTRVECAKAVLQEVIDHLERSPNELNTFQYSPDDESLSPEAKAAIKDLRI